MRKRSASRRFPSKALLVAVALVLALSLGIYDRVLRYRVIADIVYGAAPGSMQRVDVYQHSGGGLRPTLIYFHGGGWMQGRTKEEANIAMVPFLWMGWNVVNVEYRNATVAPAPAAVIDGLCATEWVFKNAAHYHFDRRRVVAMGYSAGGLLALMAGIPFTTAGLESGCPLDPDWRLAAVIDWAGVADMTDLIAGDHERQFARDWIGGGGDAGAMARLVSPIAHIGPDLPPVFIVHGDADPIVPFEQSLRLQSALAASGIRSKLWRVPGGGHVAFGRIEAAKTYAALMLFLHDAGIGLSP